MTEKKRAATISAADAQLVGCPLPAAVVARMESIRKRVALSCRISMSLTGTATDAVIALMAFLAHTEAHSYETVTSRQARDCTGPLRRSTETAQCAGSLWSARPARMHLWPFGGLAEKAPFCTSRP